MISLNLKPELFNDCMQYWRIVEEEAQRQVEQDLKEEIEVVEPEDSNYKEIQEEAKKAIPEKKVALTKKDTEEDYQEKDSSSQWTVYFSEDMFPSELSGIPRTATNNKPQTETCYDKLYPGKYFNAVYQRGNEIISVAATQYSNNEVAKTVPKICSDFVEEKFSTSEYKTSVDLERKENILGYPFWMSTASYQSSSLIAGAYSVIEDTVVTIMIPRADATETEYRNAMTVVLTYIKQKVGCGGDSDCASSLCYNCQLGKRICSKGSCVECTYDGHCNSGFKCENNYCKQKESSNPPENGSTGSGCQSIDLSVADALYNQTKASSPCDQFQNSLNGQNLITLRCADRYANWRYYWVKEMNVAGKQKIEIKADLSIKDYSSFFSECNYNGGVKYDNYVSLVVLNPMPALDVECYKKASEEEWSQCAIPNSGSAVLGFCGVSKCATSKTCDFEVDTSGEDKIYLVFHTSDAWPADIEGSLANLEICSK
jgi:hypothetical protein